MKRIEAEIEFNGEYETVVLSVDGIHWPSDPDLDWDPELVSANEEYYHQYWYTHGGGFFQKAAALWFEKGFYPLWIEEYGLYPLSKDAPASLQGHNTE